MMPSTDAKIAAANAQRVEAYTQYRDLLIQYLFVSKARHYLRQVENLDGTSDPALRFRSEGRFQRLTERLAKLDAALVGLMNNPLIDRRKMRAGSVRVGRYSAVSAMAPTSGTAGPHSTDSVTPPPVNINGLPMVGAVDVHGNPYGSTAFDGGNGLSAGADDGLSSFDAPSTNINGLPMFGGVDVHGNTFGSTSFDGGPGL